MMRIQWSDEQMGGLQSGCRVKNNLFLFVLKWPFYENHVNAGNFAEHVAVALSLTELRSPSFLLVLCLQIAIRQCGYSPIQICLINVLAVKSMGDSRAVASLCVSHSFLNKKL